MKTIFKKALPYFLTSICVVGLWRLLTWTDNYAWFPKGKELLIVDIALTSIFYYKTLFWLVVTNSTVFIIQQVFLKNYKTTFIALSTTIIFYFFVGQVVDKECASHYYSVFHNQSVSEEYLKEPIVSAGHHIGPILTENIVDKKMKYRRYAIDGLKEIKYKPAIPILAKILIDRSEIDVLRADAFQALSTFDTNETRKIVFKFRQQANDSIDKKVIENADYWAKDK